MASSKPSWADIEVRVGDHMLEGVTEVEATEAGERRVWRQCSCLACSAGTWQGSGRRASRLGEVGLGVLVAGAVGRLDGEAMDWLVGGVGHGGAGEPVPTVSH